MNIPPQMFNKNISPMGEKKKLHFFPLFWVLVQRTTAWCLINAQKKNTARSFVKHFDYIELSHSEIFSSPFTN